MYYISCGDKLKNLTVSLLGYYMIKLIFVTKVIFSYNQISIYSNMASGSSQTPSPLWLAG